MNLVLQQDLIGVAISVVVFTVLRLRYRDSLVWYLVLFFTPIAFSISNAAAVNTLPDSSLATKMVISGISMVLSLVGVYGLHRFIISRLRNQTNVLMANVGQISAASQQAAATAAEQAAAVNQVSSTTSEMNEVSRHTTTTAQEVLTISTEAVERGRRGLEALDEVLAVMERIQQVGEIVETINDLAEQSNLLAVNASIEAAKAGEYGRGFAVVASEVRNLAEQSKAATRRIREAIKLTGEGLSAVEAANGVVKELAAVLTTATDKAREISGAAQQQAAGVRQISEAIGTVAQGGKDSAQTAADLRASMVNLEGVGNALKRIVEGSPRPRPGAA